MSKYEEKDRDAIPISDDERKMQTAVGLAGEYVVYITIPVTGMVYTSYHVNAVNEEDAKNQVKKILEIETPSQILRDSSTADSVPTVSPRGVNVQDVTLPPNILKEVNFTSVYQRNNRAEKMVTGFTNSGAQCGSGG